MSATLTGEHILSITKHSLCGEFRVRVSDIQCDVRGKALHRGGILMAELSFAGLSYEQVVHKYNQTVVAVCVMRLKNWADAEDCFQNTFVRLYKNAPSLNDEAHLKAWLIRVAINECNSYIRKNKKFLSFEDRKDTAVDFPYDTSDISWALVQLEPKYRDVLYLYYCEKYKVEEIANILSHNHNTVKTLLKRGREKLKSIYGGDGI